MNAITPVRLLVLSREGGILVVTILHFSLEFVGVRMGIKSMEA